jgi:hypothetical protein
MRHSLLLIFLSVLLALPARAQVADSARVGPTAPVRAAARDSLKRPPISPTRALLQSLAVPGWGQASLHRSTAGAIFTALEVTSVAMLIQSKKELSAARAASRDSVLNVGGSGFTANPMAEVVRQRRQAVEDWVALLIFTHLLAGADAFVAAHLWDVPVQVGGSPTSGGARLTARISF